MFRIPASVFSPEVQGLDRGEVLVRQEHPRVLLGVDADGTPTAIFSVDEVYLGGDRLVGHLQVTIQPRVDILRGGESASVMGVCVQCLSAELVDAFCSLVESVSQQLSAEEHCTSELVLSVVSEWERLFRSRARLSAPKEVGLWGELWFLLSSGDRNSALLAWRGPNAEAIDFVSSAIAIEVKTSVSGHEHQTTLQQLQTLNAHNNSFLASLWVTESASGKTLHDLANEARRSLSDRAAFESKLLKTGYSDSDRYQLSLELIDSPVFVPAGAVPSVRSIDPGVLAVSFAASIDPDDGVDIGWPGIFSTGERLR